MNEQSEAQFSKPPFEISVPSLDATLSFESYEALAGWADSERAFWSRLKGITGATGNWGDVVANLIIGHFSNLSNWANQKNSSRVRSKLIEISNGDWPVSDDPTGIMVGEIFERYPDKAVAYASMAIKPDFNFGNPMSAPVKNMIEAAVERLVSEDAVSAQEIALGKVRREWQREFQSLHNEYSEIAKHDAEAQKNFREWGETAFEDGVRFARRVIRSVAKRKRNHELRMDQIEEAYKTKIAVRAADTYWGNRAESHARDAMSARELLVWVGLIGLAVVISIIWGASVFIFEGKSLDKISTMQTIIFGLPALIYIWVIRLTVGRWRRHNALKEDAEHRLSMLSTFLALNAEGIATDEERILMLSALFRSSGEEQDEEVPTPILEAVLKQAQKK